VTVTINVCVSCKKDDAKTGQQLFDALLDQNTDEAIQINPVECLSVCNKGTSVAVQSSGRWSYIFGTIGLNGPDEASDLLAYAKQYEDSEDGIVPWRNRPVVIRKNTIARIPPLVTA